MFRKIKEQQDLIRASRKALANAEIQIQERDKLIKYLSEEIKKTESKLKDYENNIEFLRNNLSAKKRARLTE